MMLSADVQRQSASPAALLPFLAAAKAMAGADLDDRAEDIEVDLGMQQALVESMAAPSFKPSSAKLHSKANALHDISNFRLPGQGSKHGAAGKRPPAPLAALKPGQLVVHTLLAAACMSSPDWKLAVTNLCCRRDSTVLHLAHTDYQKIDVRIIEASHICTFKAVAQGWSLDSCVQRLLDVYNTAAAAGQRQRAPARQQADQAGMAKQDHSGLQQQPGGARQTKAAAGDLQRSQCITCIMYPMSNILQGQHKMG